MSFILDALKKSETDRQRQSGPALYEVRVARPSRMALPPWAVAIVALLGVNLAVISWLLLHRSSSPPAATPAAAAAPPAAAPAPAGPPGYYGQPPQGAAPGQYAYYPPPQGQIPPQPGMQGQPPYGAQGAPQGYPPPAYGYPQQPAAYPGPQPGGPQPGTQPTPQPSSQPQAALADNGVSANGGGGASEDTGNPDDYAPATAPEAAAGGQVRRGTQSGLPLYPDPEAATAAGLPKLRMDFHAYGATPQQRFVMINSHSLHEGQSSPDDGIRVDEITPDGAAISKGPAKYFLPRQ